VLTACEAAIANPFFSFVLLMQTSKPNAQLIADRVAAWFVPIIVVVSLAIFGLWLALIYATSLIDTGGVHGAVYAMRFAITLLVVSCPCAVALSVPPVVVVGAGVAARNGLLVKDGRAFEQLQRITDIFFDKTGTITRGKPRVVALCTPKIAKSKRNTRKPLKYKVFALDEQPDGVREDAAARELLDVCASVEAGSEHPLARGIVLAAKEQLGEAWERRVTAEFRAIAGQGVECDVDGARAHVGTPQLLAEEAQCDVGDAAAAEKAARTAIGDLSGELSLTIVYACVGGRLLGAIVLADMPRPESAAVVRWLADKRGINVWMVTGDNASAAQCAARAVGIAPVQRRRVRVAGRQGRACAEAAVGRRRCLSRRRRCERRCGSDTGRCWHCDVVEHRRGVVGGRRRFTQGRVARHCRARRRCARCRLAHSYQSLVVVYLQSDSRSRSRPALFSL
jgi:Cu+-exporting ATPase